MQPANFYAVEKTEVNIDCVISRKKVRDFKEETTKKCVISRKY